MSKFLPALVGGVLIAGAAIIYFNAQTPDTGQTMTATDTSDIVQGDAIVSVKIPEEFSSAALIGKRAFDAKCAACHGSNAAGQNGVAPPLVHKIYEPNHHGDMAFVTAAKNGVQSHHWNFGNMPPIQGLTDADVKYIASYIRVLQRENGIN